MTTDTNLESLNNRVAIARKYVEDAYGQEFISKDLYHKSLVEIAYEYAVAGYSDEVIGILAGIEVSYFAGPMRGQMTDDERFRAEAQVVTESVMYLGMFSLQPVANA